MNITTRIFRHAFLCAAVCAAVIPGVASADVSSALPMADGCMSAGETNRIPVDAGPDKVVFPPVQVEVDTPFQPTLFASGDRNYLFYELHLLNYSDQPVVVSGFDIVRGDSASLFALATFNASEMGARSLPLGADQLTDNKLEGGKGLVVFVCLAFGKGDHVPATLRHHMRLGDEVVAGPVIGTHTTALHVLGRPVSGAGWVPADSPGMHSHHRTGIFVAGGRAQISRRYAIDWKIIRDGASFSGDALDVRSYHSYGKDVLAVAKGTVVASVDGFADNVPRTAAGFKTAVPVTLETVAGNHIVLDLGDGQYAYYAHLKAGSLRVRRGDVVRRGQVLAQIGNSGDAREPHLHFQLANSPDILDAEGLPYLIDHYLAKGADGDWESRSHEFPLGPVVIDFGVGSK